MFEALICIILQLVGWQKVQRPRVRAVGGEEVEQGGGVQLLGGQEGALQLLGGQAERGRAHLPRHGEVRTAVGMGGAFWITDHNEL